LTINGRHHFRHIQSTGIKHTHTKYTQIGWSMLHTVARLTTLELGYIITITDITVCISTITYFSFSQFDGGPTQ